MKINSQFIVIVIFVITQSSYGMSQDPMDSFNIVDSIPFNLTEHNNIVVEAILNNKDTLSMMLHTAATSVSVINSYSNKVESLKWGNEIEVSGWGGKGKSRYSPSNRLQISNIVLDSIEIWENERSGPDTQGKFGLNLFENYVVEIDFDKRLLLLYNSLPSKVSYYDRFSIENKDGLLLINGTVYVNNQAYKNYFLIHSGYSGAILLDDEFTLNSQIGELIEIISEEQLKDSFGNIVKAKKGELPKFTLGELVFNDLPVGFFEGRIGQQQMSIIGGDLIKQVNMVIDKSRSVIYLKRRNLTN